MAERFSYAPMSEPAGKVDEKPYVSVFEQFPDAGKAHSIGKEAATSPVGEPPIKPLTTRERFTQETGLDSYDAANKTALHTWLDEYNERIKKEKSSPSPTSTSQPNPGLGLNSLAALLEKGDGDDESAMARHVSPYHVQEIKEAREREAAMAPIRARLKAEADANQERAYQAYVKQLQAAEKRRKTKEAKKAATAATEPVPVFSPAEDTSKEEGLHMVDNTQMPDNVVSMGQPSTPLARVAGGEE